MLPVLATQLDSTNLLHEFMDFISNFIQVSQGKNNFLKGTRPFTQAKKMDFSMVINLLIQPKRRSLQAELFELFLNEEQDCPSKSAFSQARAKICPQLFAQLIQAQARKIDELNVLLPNTYEGYRLFAVDGSTAYLPNTGATRREFGTVGNQYSEQCLPRCSFLTDLITGVFHNAVIGTSTTSEKLQIYEHLRHIPKNSILILDRLYPCSALMYWLDRLGIRYIIRCPANFNRAVKNICSKNGSQDEWVQHRISERAVTTLKAIVENEEEETRQSISCRCEIKYRVIKTKLTDNEYENILTNIPEEWSAEDFKKLYNWRWKIETAIDKIKNPIAIESFSGLNPAHIRQDFFAAICRYNIACFMGFIAQHKLNEKQTTDNNKPSKSSKKHPKQVNMNLCVALTTIMLRYNTQQKELTGFVDKAINALVRFPEIVRPGRSFPRKKRNFKQLGRNRFCKNFRQTA